MDELHESDLLIHVVDISNINFEKHIISVQKTLEEINCVGKPQIIVFNKIDLFEYVHKDQDDLTPIKRENLSLSYWEKTWMSKKNLNSVFISSTKRVSHSKGIKKPPSTELR